MADDLEAKRNCAVYADTMNRLRNTTELSDAEIDRIALSKVDESVYGFDAKKDRQGNWIEQGIGSKGRETGNHLAAILKYEGREAHAREVARIWRETPDHARKLGLTQPART